MILEETWMLCNRC